MKPFAPEKIRLPALATLCCLLMNSVGLALAQRATNDIQKTSIAVWDKLFRASLGGGYRDNVLRSSLARESSPFLYSSAEISLIRLSDTGSQLTLFAFAEDWEYSDAPSVGAERLASILAQGLWPLGTDHQIGSEFQYLYQNQVVDLSEIDSQPRRLLVEGHGFWARPRWKWNWRPKWAVQFEPVAMRQIYANRELDDFWEPGGRLSLLRQYGHRSELSLSFQAAYRLYDSREQTDPSGIRITGAGLAYLRPELSVQLRHYWDEKRHWRTTTKVAYLWNRDNGSGYFDYERATVSQQLRWAAAGWQITGTARFGHYAYPVQTVLGELRDRTYYLLEARLEKQITKRWFVFGSGEREWNLSNDPLDRYGDWAASAGVGLEF